MTGRITLKNGYYYAVISYKDTLNRFKQKWIPTGLKERGNKKEAQKFLEQQLDSFVIPQNEETKQEEPIVDNDIMFMDYIEAFVAEKKKTLTPITYQSYLNNVKVMKEYFGNKMKLKDVTYHHLEDYYEYLKNERGNKNITVKHHAVILSPALRMAYRDDLIPKNPYEFMPKIKREKSQRKYFDKDELEELFKYSDKTKIGLIVRVAAYYGLRRSELLGLRWQSIDFKKKTITIEHKVLKVEKKIYTSDLLKTLSSNRTLPLLPVIENMFIQRQKEIAYNKKIYGMSYNTKFDDYVFVDDIGDLILPDYVTHNFGLILKRNNIKHIRFHDLRHSCASLLVANGVPMKNIQEWLGHSNFNTTADVYSHLDYSAKIQSANVIDKALTITDDDKEQLEKEIEQLNKMLAEKQAKLKKSQNEM